MKKFVMGFIVGALIFIPISIFATSNIEKIEAYINNDVKIKIDGEPFVSEYPVLIYKGRTYLPLRPVGEDLMGKKVDWDNETQTVQMTSIINGEDVWPVNDVTQSIEETTYENLKAIVIDGETYFSLKDYDDKFNPVRWGYDKNSNEMFLAITTEGTSEIVEILNRFDRDEQGAVSIYKGSTYINTKYYQVIE